MRRCLKILVISSLFSLIINPSVVYAHPGRTASDGCHYCRTNCAKWGYTTGTRHCHGGSTSVVSPTKPVTTYKPSTTIKPTIRPTLRPSIKPSYTPIPSSNDNSSSSENGGSSIGWLLAGGAGVYGYQWLKGKK